MGEMVRWVVWVRCSSRIRNVVNNNSWHCFGFHILDPHWSVQQFMRQSSIEYGNRVLLSVASLGAFSAWRTFLRLGYNSGVFTNARTETRSYSTEMEFVACVVIQEAVLHLLILNANQYLLLSISFLSPWKNFMC